MEFAVARLDVPKAVVGIIIAALVLLPESLAAVRAAVGNRLQTSLNLALGSALATIGLTIPAVAVVGTWLGCERSSFTGSDPTSRHDHVGHRPDDRAAGHRAFGHLRRLFVLCGGAVKQTRSGHQTSMLQPPFQSSCSDRYDASVLG